MTESTKLSSLVEICLERTAEKSNFISDFWMKAPILFSVICGNAGKSTSIQIPTAFVSNVWYLTTFSPFSVVANRMTLIVLPKMGHMTSMGMCEWQIPLLG